MLYAHVGLTRAFGNCRRFFGHKRTIRPNAKKLNSLYLNRHNMSWDTFALKVRAYQKGFMGEPNEVRPGRGEFHEYPSSCICERPDAKEKIDIITQYQSKTKNKKLGDHPGQTVEPRAENELINDDTDWPDMDELEETTQLQQQADNEDIDLEYNPFTRTDEPELEEMLSD